MFTAILLALSLALTPTGVPVRGVASWYDATYTPKHGVGGQSTWYTRPPYRLKYYAAVGSWRWGDKPYRLQLCRQDDPSRCVVVTVVDRCSRCRKDLMGVWTKKSRAIDISPAAFIKLAPLGSGLVRVSIREIQQP